MSFDPGDERIAGFLREHYGLEGSLTLLPGENRNLLVETSEGPRFVLKLAEFRESRDGFELERLAVEALNFAGFDRLGLPLLVPTIAGPPSADLALDDFTFDGRLLRYVPGTVWADAAHSSKELRQDLGRFLARLGEALATVETPLAFRTHLWDPTKCSRLRDKVAGIEDRAKQRILDKAFLLFEASVPRFDSLPHSLIHSDVNEGNVLVENGRVCGLIDFDDCLYNPTVCELAVSLAYLLLDEPSPLVAGADIVAAYHEIRPLSSAELEVLFPLMCGRLAVSLAVSSERLLIDPDREAWFTTAAPAWKALERYVEIDPMTAADTLAAGTGVAVYADRSAPPAGISERRDEVISGALALSFERPLKIARGRAQFLFDERERPYLDLYNNVCHVGHCHPRVVEAGTRQMARLNTNTRYLYDQLVEYGERLCATFPDRLDHCFVVNSGTEANELAVRLARTYTGRKDMIVLEGAYHGHTNTMIEISPYKFLGRGGTGRPEPWVHVASLPDGYRGQYRGQGPDAGQAYGDDVGKIIDALDSPLAAFMCESLPSCGGQIIPPEGYLATAYGHVRAAGGVCIADEVQVGFGRIGSHFWGFEQQGVVPDIVVMGKPIGNGHPLAAVVTTSEIAQAFADNGMEFFSTFGGNPVSCAIGTAVLDVIRDENLQENARVVGNYLHDGLRELMDRHTLIGDVRGEGLFIGIELVRDRETLEPATSEASAVVDALREARVLVGTDGVFDNVIKIKPPLVVTRADADLAIRLVDDILARTPSGTSP